MTDEACQHILRQTIMTEKGEYIMAIKKENDLNENVINDEDLADAVGGAKGKAGRLITNTPKHMCANGLDIGRVVKWFGKYGTLVPSTSLGPNGEQLFRCTNCGAVGYIEFCANRKYCYLRACRGTSGPVQL